MGKLFVIMGKSATGKDSLYQRIVEDFPELQQVVTYTTRPIRAGETYGKEYFFVSEEEMHEMQEDDKIIECRVYQTVHGPWYYFTANDGQINLEKGNYILITTLEGYRKLETFFGIDQVVPIYIEVDDFDRIERALKREKSRIRRAWQNCAAGFSQMKRTFRRKNWMRQALTSVSGMTILKRRFLISKR